MVWGPLSGPQIEGLGLQMVRLSLLGIFNVGFLSVSFMELELWGDKNSVWSDAPSIAWH